MLPRQNRLTDNYDFKRVKRIGEKYRCPFFHAAYAPAKDEKQPSRFGFVISNKIDKRATTRNRIKRLLRETIRKRLEEIKPGYDVTIVAHHNLKNADYKKVSDQINKFLSEISLLRPRMG